MTWHKDHNHHHLIIIFFQQFSFVTHSCWWSVTPFGPLIFATVFLAPRYPRKWAFLRSVVTSPIYSSSLFLFAPNFFFEWELPKRKTVSSTMGRRRVGWGESAVPGLNGSAHRGQSKLAQEKTGQRSYYSCQFQIPMEHETNHCRPLHFMCCRSFLFCGGGARDFRHFWHPIEGGGHYNPRFLPVVLLILRRRPHPQSLAHQWAAPFRWCQSKRSRPGVLAVTLLIGDCATLVNSTVFGVLFIFRNT